MVGIKQAVKESLANFVDLFPEEKDSELRLEEASLTDDLLKWKITVSYANPAYRAEVEQRNADSTGIPFHLDRHIPRRFYKTLLLTSSDGKLVGFRNDWDTAF